MNSSGKFKTFYKIVTPAMVHDRVENNQDINQGFGFNNFTWYYKIVQGAATRIYKYKEYDAMDSDDDVARALDTIASEMVNIAEERAYMFDFHFLNDSDSRKAMNTGTAMTIREASRHFCIFNKLSRRKLYRIARDMIKYGDVLFQKDARTGRWKSYISPKNIICAVVEREDVSNITAWVVRKNINESRGSAHAQSYSSRVEEEPIDASEVVRFTTNDDMSDFAPFGESILKAAYRTFKQKQLLEDSIVIYRITRAPEKRVFYVDVGKLQGPRAKAYLDQFKNEISQKKVPTFDGGGQSSIDSVYNPQSMNEDFFLATRGGERGTRIETLPAGQNLGDLSELDYFKDKMWRGLRIPSSYMRGGAGTGAVFSDGKVGVAYMEEYQFTKFVSLLRSYLEEVLDYEFKEYLRIRKVNVDTSSFYITLPESQNFSKYRQQEMDSMLLNSLNLADGIGYISKRFIMKRFLKLTDDEILENERLLRQEKNIDNDEVDGGEALIRIYQPQDAQEVAMGLSYDDSGGGGDEEAPE